ncbi:hypothetical protein, partial [uncultured Selenomonas sp.]|uniref:hypothetical protein n=1 Tax=uncultured Selenomonas sp. TaxID=159275 RepID=UPI0026766745
LNRLQNGTFCVNLFYNLRVAVIVWAAHPFAQFFPQNNLKAAPLSLTASPAMPYMLHKEKSALKVSADSLHPFTP